ncbi:hypothetical protein MTQ01_16395 [Streptomyces sp. XM4193]|uniref:hypothetical protein n=1 Tax=Streptomyces sp. XM4193 TaxID=2929782 RepID=UPI001FFAEE8D|nr:hypothetical protein [Streptomyces sp. XM4193]MCK1797578.1 hypothetical protein [Streptomyces sp. XM4193]
MELDVAGIVQQSWPYIGAAVGAYGTAVVTRVGDDSADATVTFGRRLLNRLWRREETRPFLLRQLGGVADDPANEAARTALLEELRRMLVDDEELRRDLAELLGDAPAAPANSFHATGERSVAVATNNGVIATGDNTRIERDPRG